MDAGKLSLTIVTPERAVVSALACDAVTLPAEKGELGLLPGHAALVALLGTGVATYRDGAQRGAYAIRGGFFEVAGENVRVLADQAVASADVDVALATKDRDGAERRRADVVGDEQLDAVNADAAFAEARLAVAAAVTTGS